MTPVSFRPTAPGDTCEVNFEGLPGPSYLHAGLPIGNLAAARNAAAISNPRLAAFESIRKMRALHALGVKQVLVPPYPRPSVSLLRACGYTGTDADVILSAGRERPDLLRASYSAAGMWFANAASVSPSSDTGDGRLHVTPSNMVTNVARAIDSRCTDIVMRWLLPEEIACHHAPLPPSMQLSDEGAANAMRFCRSPGEPGVTTFVFGRTTKLTPAGVRKQWGTEVPMVHEARHAYDASEAIARQHGLRPDAVSFIRQNPRAIDGGAFHNDVIATSHENILLFHSDAFVNADQGVSQLRTVVERVCQVELVAIEISAEDLSVEQAVKTYLFNSQIVTVPSGRMVMLVTEQCVQDPQACAVLKRLVADRRIPIDEFYPVALSESMTGGGGPACLRLRVMMTRTERERVPMGAWIDDGLLEWLEEWATTYYRTKLDPTLDVTDPSLAHEVRNALEVLYDKLGAPNLAMLA